MKHLVVLVHGIRTRAYWMSDLTPVLQNAGLVVAATSYGRFNLLKFIIPGSWLKNQAIDDIRKQIAAAIDDQKPDKVSIIAHSFGTFVIARIMANESQTKWERVILCGSVINETFDFGQYRHRFLYPILNEIGTQDIWPALAANMTWGYGSIGSNGLNHPSVKNRWHEGLTHSDFLTPDFANEYWVPFLTRGEIREGGPAKPSRLSRLTSEFPLKSVLLTLFAFLILFWPYIWINAFQPEANLAGCGPTYTNSTASNWRNDNLRADQPNTYYVIIKSIQWLRNFPMLNHAYAELEAYRIRRRFPKIDVDAMATANPLGTNKMWAIVLARAVSTEEYACEVKKLGDACGIAESTPAFVYELKNGPRGCH